MYRYQVPGILAYVCALPHVVDEHDRILNAMMLWYATVDSCARRPTVLKLSSSLGAAPGLRS